MTARMIWSRGARRDSGTRPPCGVPLVSGRASFEIVQKAWIGGVGLVCAVSAPSTLAIDLAESAGITLLGFARDGGFNIYTHASRIGA